MDGTTPRIGNVFVAIKPDPDGPGSGAFFVCAHVHPIPDGGIEARLVPGARGALSDPPEEDIRFALAGLFAWATTPNPEPPRHADGT